MTTVTTCCTPCAAVPVAPQPTTTTTDVAALAPQPVTGGGSPAATYSPAQVPTTTGQYVPAPVAGDTPPEPIAGPASTTDELPATPAPTSTGTAPGVAGSASTLATWPQWQAEFTKLGVSAADVARIGGSTLSNEQLAQVYEQIHAGALDGVPASKAAGWDASWDAKFLALGMTQAQVTELGQKAQSTGATTADIEAVYQQAVQQSGATTPGQGPQAPGWSAEWEAKFTQLGMPADIVKVYAGSGATAAGLEAAFNTAAEKLADFRERGWADKFEKAGVPASDMWGAILSEPKLDDKTLQAVVDGAKSGKMNGWQKALQAGITFFPGGELVQYALGRKIVSGKEIDRSSPMNIGFAALSGLALFASIRGVGNITKGLKAAGGGFENLTRTGVQTQGASVAADTALGAMQNWGAKQKILSFIPGTQMHKLVVGAGHAEAAAKAFNGGGLANILKQPDGAHLASTLGSMFDDIKTGRTLIQGPGNAYIGLLGKSSKLPMSLSATKEGQQLISVVRGLRIGDGRTQLAALAGVGGQQIAAAGQHGLGSTAQSLSSIMAGNVARATGIGNDGVLATLALKRAASSSVNPAWYLDLAAKSAAGGGSSFVQGAAPKLTAETQAIVANAIKNQGARLQDLQPVRIKSMPAATTTAAPVAPAAAPAAAAPSFTRTTDAIGRPGIQLESGGFLYTSRDLPTGGGSIDPKAIAAFSERIASGS